MIIKNREKEEEEGEKLEEVFKEKFKILNLKEQEQDIHEASIRTRKDDEGRESKEIERRKQEDNKEKLR